MSTHSEEKSEGAILAGGLFLVSAATLLFEVAMNRIFCFVIWYHFAFLAISMALLGFSASGSILMLWRGHERLNQRRLLSATSLLSSLTIVVVIAFVTQVPFDPFEMMNHASAVGIGIALLLVTTVPFAFAGATIAIALKANTEKAGLLYFGNLVGSGIGCALFPFLANVLGVPQVLTVAALLFCLGSVLFAPSRRFGIVVRGLIIVVAVQTSISLMEFRPSSRKLGSIFREKMGGQILWTKWHALLRTDVYDFPDKAKTQTWLHRAAIGASKNYEGPIPEFRNIGHDGDACAIMLHLDRPPEEMDFFKNNLFGLAYYMRPGAKAFIGGVGGGRDVMAALANGAREIDGVELDPYTVDIVKTIFPDYIGNVCNRDGVRIRAGDARSELRRNSVSYDVIQLSNVDTITAVAGGAYLLCESYLYTVEAVHDYLDHLNTDGVLAFTTFDTSGVSGTPRMLPRLTATAVQALEERGVPDPAQCCVLMTDRLPGKEGYFAFGTLIIKPAPFSPHELDRLEQFAEAGGHVFWHYPGREIETIPSEIFRRNPADRKAYFAESYLNYSPATDDRPFFMHFYKWRSLLTDTIELDPRYTGATGNIVLLAGLAFSILAVIPLVLVPAILAVRNQKLNPRSTSLNLVYFSAIGLGFMFLEMALIQRLVLLLGYPTYSLTVTLFAVLVFAGLGSYLTRSVSVDSSKPVWLAFLGLAVLVALYGLFGDAVLLSMITWSLPARVLAATGIIAPLALLLGMFFPIGIRDLGHRSPGAIPLAWAANGSCSVIATILGLVLATVLGFRMVFFLALALYLLAALSFHAIRTPNTVSAAEAGGH